MRKMYYGVFMAIIIGFASCDELPNSNDESDGVGFVKIGLGSIDVEKTNARQAEINTDEWSVSIYNSSDEVVQSWDRYADVPEQIELVIGDYTVFVSSNDNGVGFDAPFYSGTSDVFTIKQGEEREVVVQAALVNVKVTIQYSESVNSDFEDWKTVVYSGDDSLVFEKGETRSGYFVADRDLSVNAALFFTQGGNSEVRRISKTIDNTSANEHYVFTIDYKLETGVLSPLSIEVDETTTNKEFTLSNSITFSKTFGGSGKDEMRIMNQTSDGGYILGGYGRSSDGDASKNQGSVDYWLIKLDERGELVWEKSFGGSSEDFLHSVIETSDGGYLAAGNTHSSNGDISNMHGFVDVWVVKVDASGNLEWQETYGGTHHDAAWGVVENNDGDFVIAGATASTNGDVSEMYGSVDFWVIKINATGELIWENNYGGSSDDRARGITMTNDGGYIVSGYSNSSDRDAGTNKGGEDIFIIKIDRDGVLEWSKTLGGSGAERAYRSIQTNDGNYIVSGRSNSSNGDITSNKGDYDVCFVKLDVSGNILWIKSYGGSGSEWGSMFESKDGNYLVSISSSSNDGDVSSNFGDFDIWYFKVNTSFELIWEKFFGGSNFDGGTVEETPDNGFVLWGTTASTDGNTPATKGGRDFMIVKMNSSLSLD